jgi:hypothetical protein
VRQIPSTATLAEDEAPVVERRAQREPRPFPCWRTDAILPIL